MTHFSTKKILKSRNQIEKVKPDQKRKFNIKQKNGTQQHIIRLRKERRRKMKKQKKVRLKKIRCKNWTEK